MKQTLVIMLVLCVNPASAQESRVPENLVGIWEEEFLGRRMGRMTYKKLVSESLSYRQFERDGTYHSLMSIPMHMPNQYMPLKRSGHWRYDPETRLLTMISQGMENKTDTATYLLGYCTDTALVLYDQGVMSAEDIMPYRDFEKLSDFIRTYGDWERYSDQHANQAKPHFRFPEADIYLTDVTHEKVSDTDTAHRYYGLHYKGNDGVDFALCFPEEQYVLIPEIKTKKDGKEIEQRLKEISKLIADIPVFAGPYGYLLANEGQFVVDYPETKSETPSRRRVRLNALFGTDTALFHARKVIYPGEASPGDDFLSKSNLFKVAETCYNVFHDRGSLSDSEMLYDFHLRINGKVYVLPIQFFNRQGAIEAISENNVIKVKLVPSLPDTALHISPYFYYQLAILWP